MQIGEIIQWTIPAIYNGVGIAGKPVTIGSGTINKLGTKYLTVETFITVGPNSYPTTCKVLKSDIINPSPIRGEK